MDRKVSPNSLANLDKGREIRKKEEGAIRVNVSLKPSTHAALKKLPPNVSGAIDRLVEWVKASGEIDTIFLGGNPHTHDRIKELELALNNTHDRIERLEQVVSYTHNRNQQLEVELAEARSQLSSQVAASALELPDPADLLNQLKAKRKKSAATLADVVAILEMIEELAPMG